MVDSEGAFLIEVQSLAFKACSRSEILYFFSDTLCFKEKKMSALFNIPNLFSHEDFNQPFVVIGYN